MPVQKLNRVMRNYTADLAGYTPNKFIDFVEKITAISPFNQNTTINISIVHEGTQVTGNSLPQIKQEINQIEKDEQPHTYSCNLTANTNPRKTLAISVNFANKIVSLNAQNLDKTEGQKVIKIFSEEFKEVQPVEKGQVQKEIIQTQEEIYLPGPFRPTLIPQTSEKDVFIIMSFKPEHRDAYFVVIEPLLKELGLNPVRIDQIQHNQTITTEIVSQIEKSVFVIADLTGESPNVYYEVGYAHRANKEVILLAKEGTAVHFDIAAINRIEYSDYTFLKSALKKRIESTAERLGLVLNNS